MPIQCSVFTYFWVRHMIPGEAEQQVFCSMTLIGLLRLVFYPSLGPEKAGSTDKSRRACTLTK